VRALQWKDSDFERINGESAAMHLDPSVDKDPSVGKEPSVGKIME